MRGGAVWRITYPLPVPKPSPPTGPLLVLAAAALWGTTGTAQALGPEGISPATVAVVRMAGGATLLLYALWRQETVPVRRLVGLPLMASVAAMAASQPLFFTGVARTGVAVGTIVTIGTGPILAGLIAWVVRREPPGRRWVPATAMAVAGTVLVVSGGEAAGIDGAGVSFALGAGLAWAVYLVSTKALFDRHPPVFVVAVIFTAAAVLLSPGLAMADTSWLTTARGTLVAMWLALAATALSYVFFARGLSGSRVATAATLTLAEPVTAAILGMTVLGEPVLATTLLGIALVAGGLLILARERPPEPVPQ